MARKPTYEELEQRVKELEKEAVKRKRAEEALQESEEKFRALYEQAGDAIHIHDLEGRYMDVNKRTCEMLGYTREELLRMSVPDIDPNFSMPDDKERFWSNLKSTGPFTVERVLRRKDGSMFPAEVCVGPVESGGQTFALVLARNITDRKRAEKALKESEEQIRLTVENAPLGIGTVYLDGRFRTMNQAYCDMLGYSSEELSNMTFDDISHPDDREKSHKAFQDLLDRKVARLEFEKRYIHKDGSVVDVIQRSGIVYDSSGNPLFIIGISEDVTEKKRLH